MSERASSSARSADAPRSVRFWLGVLRDRWWVVALIGLLVLLWRGYVAMTQAPIYMAQASIRFEAPHDAKTGLASMWMSDSLDTILAAETFALRSARVAERAARLYPRQVVVAQRHSWRPFEVTLVDLGWASPPCMVVATSAPDAPWTHSRRLKLDFDGPDGAARLWHPGTPGPTVFDQRRPDGSLAVTLDGNEITLRVGSSSPQGRVFDLVVRTKAELVAWLRAGSTPASAGSGTGVLYVGFTAGTPEEARLGAQALTDAYKALRDEDTRKASEERTRWLKAQAAALAAQAKAAEERFDEYVARTGSLLLGDQAKGMIEDLGRLLSERLSQEHLLSGEREVLAELEAATEPARVLVLLGSAGADSMITAWAERVADLEAQRGALLRTEGKPDHPVVKRLQAEIDEGRKQLGSHLTTARERAIELQRRKLARLEARIQGLIEERERVEARLKALPGEERATERLQREVRLIAETYEQILRWQKEAELKGVAEEAPISLVDRAETPEARLSPVLSRSLAVALLLALVLGVAAALLLHWRDHTIRMPTDLEEATGLTLFGVIPAYGSVPRVERRGLKGGLPAAEVPDSVLAEAYRALRANLRLRAWRRRCARWRSPRRPPRRVRPPPRSTWPSSWPRPARASSWWMPTSGAQVRTPTWGPSSRPA